MSKFEFEKYWNNTTLNNLAKEIYYSMQEEVSLEEILKAYESWAGHFYEFKNCHLYRDGKMY